MESEGLLLVPKGAWPTSLGALCGQMSINQVRLPVTPSSQMVRRKEVGITEYIKNCPSKMALPHKF